MRTLEEIDTLSPVEVSPMGQDLDAAIVRGVDGLQAIKLYGGDAELFVAWAKAYWRKELEHDLQSISEDLQGRPLLSTWMPLVTFRTELCGGGRHLQDGATRELMERLRSQTREWRSAGCDVVDISSHIARTEHQG